MTFKSRMAGDHWPAPRGYYHPLMEWGRAVANILKPNTNKPYFKEEEMNAEITRLSTASYLGSAVSELERIKNPTEQLNEIIRDLYSLYDLAVEEERRSPTEPEPPQIPDEEVTPEPEPESQGPVSGGL